MQRNDIKILVVEDDDDTRSLILHMLEECNVNKVFWAENGQVALERIDARTPDIIICDWNMPKMNGLELLKKIRETSYLENVAFLMVTAVDKKAEVEVALKQGVNDYIVKPFKKSDLVSKVNKLIEKRLLGLLTL